jgi:Autographiviridae endonuclease VII
MSRKSEWEKKKRAEDPVYRASKLASDAAYKKSHRKEIEAKRATKKQEDPIYAEKVRAQDREWRRKYNFKRLYGITVEEYDAMVARQGGRCKICKKKSNELLYVDHCHATLGIRGLLCRHCNFMLGFAKDDPDILEEGSRYLRRFLRKMRRLLGHGRLAREPSSFRRRNRYRPRKRCPAVPCP